MKKKTSVKETSKKKNTLSTSFKLYYLVMIICYLYLGFACVYKYMKYSSLDKCVLELMLILTLSLIIEYVHIISNNGRDMRKKLSKKANKNERVKRYIGECLIFALIVTTLIFIGIATNRINVNFYNFAMETYGSIAVIIVLLTLLVFFDIFVVGLILNYTISERLVKKQK